MTAPGPLTSVVLGNGLRVRLLPTGHRGVACVVLTIASGAGSDPWEASGLAHMVEHLTFRRAPAPGGGVGAIERAGGMCSATTHHEHTEFVSVLPAESVDEALAAEAHRLRPPETGAEALRGERGVVLAEIAALSSGIAAFPWDRLPPLLHGPGPHTRLPHGERDAVARLTGDTAAEFHSAHYVPSNTVVTVAGDICPQRTLESVGRHFESFPPGGGPAVPDPPARPLDPGAHRAEERGGPPGIVLAAIGYPAAALRPDRPGSLGGLVVAELLAARFRGHVSRRADLLSARVDHGRPGQRFTSAAASTLAVRIAHPDTTDTGRLVAEVDGELEQISSGRFSEQEMRRAVAALTLEQLRLLDDLASVAAGIGRSEAVLGDPAPHLELSKELEELRFDQVCAAAGRSREGGRAVVRVLPREEP
ncbi:insulinase family protein [Nocardiopsis sp. CNT-189]|uniref:M16 family metallopeptidase n=1 Tax=Nocardiopsis oceanisediminis TaxID=2816862 RepID=UPI003B37FE80